MHARISGLGTIPVCHMTMTNLLWVWSGSMRAPTLVSILCIILRYGLGSNRAGFLDLSYRHAEYVGQADTQVRTGKSLLQVKGQKSPDLPGLASTGSRAQVWVCTRAEWGRVAQEPGDEFPNVMKGAKLACTNL